MTVITSDAILLRSHDYSESSRIFRFLTPELGVVSLLGRGVRTKGGKGEAPIQSFGEGSITFQYKPERDLQTLRETHSRDGSLALGRGIQRFVGAALISELLLTHSMNDGDRDLYNWVRDVLRHLAEDPESQVLGRVLSGAWRTLAHMGFTPRLSSCARCDREFSEGADDADWMVRFDAAQGGIVCSECAARCDLPRIGPQAWWALTLLVQGSPPDRLRGARAHLSLLEGFAVRHLEPKQGFRSFDALRAVLNKTEA
jgi:DNA repair protein RecO (recombination protein O)